MAVPTKLISTSIGFQNSKGTLVALGFLRLQLSQNAEITSGGGQVTNQPLFLPLDANGKITSQAIWFNDELSPSSTVYSAQLYDSNGLTLITDFGYWSITGASADLSTMVPTSVGASYPSPALLTPTTLQTFAGPISAANTVSGNLAMKPSASALAFVASFGSDSNDGLSWGSAKFTISAALTQLPAQGGTIYFTGTITENSPITLKSNVNIIGTGSAQIDSVTGPATITTTIASGDLFYFNGFNDCRLADFSIKKTAGATANSAIRMTAAQRNTIERIYISGAFAKTIILDSSSSAAASCIWNTFRSVHITGQAASGIGLILDSADATTKVINSNSFWDVRINAGSGGVACKLTNSGVHNQVINENVFNLTEASATTGTALLVDQGSTRGCIFVDCNLEGSTTGFNKAITNTIAFIGGNISANGTNVTDAQPLFTIFQSTNVGGTVQTFAVTPAGGLYVDGLGLNASTPLNNTINGATGWALAASGTTIASITTNGLSLAKILNLYNNVATVSNGVGSFVAKADATAQAANIGSTLLYAVPASGAGKYRVIGYAVVTQQATTSSTLPNIQVTFTDNDTNVVGAATSVSGNSAGTPVNPTVGFSSGQIFPATGNTIINCKASTNINWQTGNYASVGGTPMQYAVHVLLEYLGN